MPGLMGQGGVATVPPAVPHFPHLFCPSRRSSSWWSCCGLSFSSSSWWPSATPTPHLSTMNVSPPRTRLFFEGGGGRQWAPHPQGPQ